MRTSCCRQAWGWGLAWSGRTGGPGCLLLPSPWGCLLCESPDLPNFKMVGTQISTWSLPTVGGLSPYRRCRVPTAQVTPPPAAGAGLFCGLPSCSPSLHRLPSPMPPPPASASPEQVHRSLYTAAIEGPGQVPPSRAACALSRPGGTFPQAPAPRQGLGPSLSLWCCADPD